MDRIHGQEVVAMAKLEVHDLHGGLDLSQLSGLSRAALSHHVLQQEAVLADSLHGLQQIRPQVHFVGQLQLLLLVEETKQSRQCTGKVASVRIMFKLCWDTMTF